MNTKQRQAIVDEAKKGNYQEIEWWCSSFPEFATEARAIVSAIKARKWCRQHGYTTRKGSQHTIDGRDNSDLWAALSWAGQAEGISWKLVKVDQIRNIYLQF